MGSCQSKDGEVYQDILQIPVATQKHSAYFSIQSAAVRNGAL